MRRGEVELAAALGGVAWRRESWLHDWVTRPWLSRQARGGESGDGEGTAGEE
jgi:hypothetical protein